MALFVTNCSEALIAAVAVRSLSDAPSRFDTLRRMTAFIIGAVLAAPFVSSFADAARGGRLQGRAVLAGVAHPILLQRAHRAHARARHRRGDHARPRVAAPRVARQPARGRGAGAAAVRHVDAGDAGRRALERVPGLARSAAGPPAPGAVLGGGPLWAGRHQRLAADDRPARRVVRVARQRAVLHDSAGRGRAGAADLPHRGGDPAPAARRGHRRAPSGPAVPAGTAALRGDALPPLRRLRARARAGDGRRVRELAAPAR